MIIYKCLFSHFFLKMTHDRRYLSLGTMFKRSSDTCTYIGQVIFTYTYSYFHLLEGVKKKNLYSAHTW